ncbi:MAG: hypothetical protein K0Q55_1566 [Verrucomicrobia bacterium]|jgi:hypothetical protein|nr:hypothetical protein [Verrucomicrobiota bacterium]
MNSKQPMPTILIAAFLCLVGRCVTQACPDCNIHNYLFSSLRSSSNVFVGEFVGSGKVKVTKVYRGTNVVGTVVDVKTGSSAFNDNQLIFSDPKSHDLNFERLPLDFDWETKFILRKPWAEPDLYPQDGISKYNQKTIPDVNHKVDALRAVQGISIVTRELGLQYVKANAADCALLIESEITRLQSNLVANGKPRRFTYSYEGLALAYWAAKPNGALTNYLAQIERFKSQPRSSVDLSQFAAKLSDEFKYLSMALRSAKGTGQEKRLAERLKAVIPQLEGDSLVGALYVADYSKLFEPEEIKHLAEKLAKEQPGKKDAVALAFYHLGCEYGPSWDYAKSLPSFVLAKAHCDKAELLQELDKRIQWLQQRGRR